MRGAQAASNSEKSIAGQEVKEGVARLLATLVGKGLVKSVESEVNKGHRDYTYGQQFKSDFVVETIDSKFILIRASNSYRSDRAKISFYDFLGIQQYSEFAGEIVASILLFPDSEQANQTFLTTRRKVQSGEFFSPATHWLTFSEIDEFFQNYSSEVLEWCETEASLQEESKFDLEDEGFRYTRTFQAQNLAVNSPTNYDGGAGRSGNMFERYLVAALNDPSNLTAYKANNRKCLEYDVVLNCLLESFSLEVDEISFLLATDTITKLKNGGSAKTDVSVKIFTSPSKYFQANISVKNTKKNRVSCHDYKAKDFARVIAPEDSEFGIFVELFQEAGSWEGYESILAQKKLTLDTDALLQKYMTRIVEWAITGAHDEDLAVDSKLQIADFLLTRNSNTGGCKLESCQRYIAKICEKRAFGRSAPFAWTYPSKQRGQRIQLKMPLELP